MGLRDIMEKLKDIEEYVFETKENLNDIRATILKALDILENINDDDLYCVNSDLSADLDNVTELLNELIDEE